MSFRTSLFPSQRLTQEVKIQISGSTLEFWIRKLMVGPQHLASLIGPQAKSMLLALGPQIVKAPAQAIPEEVREPKPHQDGELTYSPSLGPSPD